MNKKLLLTAYCLLQMCCSFAADTIFSADKGHYLIEENHRRIYRRSFLADYRLDGNHLIHDAECMRFTPDGKKAVFVRANNLFLLDVATKAEQQITTDGKPNSIINGKPDWVYEEEFGLKTFFDISTDSKTIAWIRTDESRVKTFSFPWYQGTYPSKTDYALYPGTYEYKYPKAGEENSKVSVLSYDIYSGTTTAISIPMDDDGYIPRIAFTSQTDKVAVTTLNRHQNHFEIFIANTSTGKAERILTLETEKYFREDLYSGFRIQDDRFVLLDDRDGYNHLYLYDTKGKLISQLTKGAYDVTKYYGCSTDGRTFFYASHEQSPLEQNIYKVTIKGKKTCLTPQKGWHEVTFRNDFKDFNDDYSHINSKLKDGDLPAELFTFTTSDGVELNGWMVRPKDDGKKHPVLMYQYSGPGSQEVKNSWNVGFGRGLVWERKMAEKGYVVVCVDGRGTGGRGADFLKCTYLTMGDKESHDQVEAAIWLGKQPYVDKDRIAIWGWSFGGFNTLLSMSEGRPVFKCGIAVAPVTDWRYYDSVYTERFMRTPQENPQGYDISPIHRYKQLHGNVLIIHGLADDNVHFQNTAEYVEKLVQQGTQFQMQTYTNRNHSIYGGKTREHLFKRIEDFLEQNL